MQESKAINHSITVRDLEALGFVECEEQLYKTNCFGDPVVRFEEGELKVYQDPRQMGEDFFEVIRSFKSYPDFLEWFNLTTEPSDVPHSSRALSTPETLEKLGFVSKASDEGERFTFLPREDRYPLTLKLIGEFSHDPESERYYLEVYLKNPEGKKSMITGFDHHAEFVRWLELTYPAN